MLPIEEIIDIMENKHGAIITRGYVYYNVKLWDKSIDAIQNLDLTEEELVELYERFFHEK